MAVVTITADVKWYRFGQNNSGGYFVRNENVCEEVFTQARNATEALHRGELFLDNCDSCPCCGERWNTWIEDQDGTEVPMIYDEPLTEARATPFRKEARLHHYDGRIETVTFA